jgi:hypothetical protein
MGGAHPTHLAMAAVGGLDLSFSLIPQCDTMAAKAAAISSRWLSHILEKDYSRCLPRMMPKPTA